MPNYKYIIDFLELMDSKIISISKRNYENLKNCGRAGDSFNDVLDRIFENKVIKNKNNIVLGANAQPPVKRPRINKWKLRRKLLIQRY